MNKYKLSTNTETGAFAPVFFISPVCSRNNTDSKDNMVEQVQLSFQVERSMAADLDSNEELVNILLP